MDRLDGGGMTKKQIRDANWAFAEVRSAVAD